MKTNLSLLGSVLLASSIGLTACDSATATNEKQAAEVKKAVVEKVDAAKQVAQEAPEVAAEKVAEATESVKEAVAPKVEQAATEVAATATAAASQAQAIVKAPQFVEGEHYFEIFPTMQTDAVGGKVEVVELMWLGCPHCFDLEPTMKEYKKTLPDYVDFKQVPAMLNPRWKADGKMFYVAELLDPKGEKKLIDKVFHAIHVQKRRNMSEPDNLKNFMLQQGVTAEEYANVVDSMAMTAKLNRAQQISADSQAQSVPSIIINGKYRTSPYAAGGNAQLLQIVDMLTKRELDK